MLLVLVAFTCATSNARAAEPYPATPLVGAHSARAFGDSVGVNVHLTWLDSSYGNFNTLEARLRELGVRYVRDGLCATCQHQLDRLKRLGQAGIRANIIAGELSGGTAQMEQNLRAIRDHLRDAVVSVEPPNEPNLAGDPQWIEHIRAYQPALYRRVKNDPALAHLTVLGPAVGYPAVPADIGDLSSHLDRGNDHPYPGGGIPFDALHEVRLRAAAISGAKPLVATEAGYHSDLATTSGHHPASERASGIYMPRLALEGFRGGVERVYIYQLADPWSPAEAQRRGFSAMENSFGLLRWDLSPKPSFLALRNLLRAVGAGSAPVAAPGALRYAVENAGPDLRQLLLRSADGAYSLVLWRGVSVWDRATRRDLLPPPQRVEVVLGEPMLLAQRFDPVDSEVERARWWAPGRIPVDVAGAPVVLRLTPPGAAAVREVTSAPSLARTRKRQRLRRHVVLKVSCAPPCARVTGKGTLRVLTRRPRRRKAFKLKPDVKAARNGSATLRLKIPRRARRVAVKALKRGGRVTAKVMVTSRTRSGLRIGTARTRIRLRLAPR